MLCPSCSKEVPDADRVCCFCAFADLVMALGREVIDLEGLRSEGNTRLRQCRALGEKSFSAISLYLEAACKYWQAYSSDRNNKQEIARAHAQMMARRRSLTAAEKSLLARQAREFAARCFVREGGYEHLNRPAPEIAYWVRRELDDDLTCEVCRNKDGTTWDRSEDIDWYPGLDCESPDGCRGDLISHYADEGKVISLPPSDPELVMRRELENAALQTACAICSKPLTLVPNVFNRTVHDHCRETHGYIGKFKLTEWWFSAFTEEERQYIEMAFQPMGFQLEAGGTKPNADDNSLLTGSRDVQIYGRAGSNLANLAEWLNKPESRHLARRILEHAEAIAQEPVEKHDVYQVMIVVYYRDREKSPEFFEAAISACQKQISIAPDAIREWGKMHPGVLPTHKGYEQLAIIREKQGDFAEAIRLSKEAMEQGWEPKGAWEHRIQRCERRLAKPKELR